MPELDTRSISVVLNMLALLCSGILLMLRRSFPSTIGGLSSWSLALFGFVMANVVGASYALLPTFPILLVLANVLLVLAAMCFYVGFRQFAARAVPWRALAVALLLLCAGIAWFTYVDVNYHARVLLVTAVNGTLFLLCAREVRGVAAGTLSGRFTATVFFILGFGSLVRAVLLLFKLDTPNGFFSASAGQQMYFALLSFATLASTFGAMMMANERLRATLEFLVSHDQLTGAFSRAAFIELLTKELARGRRSPSPTAVLMFDLDHFKSINDRFGHAVGDQVLIDFVKRTRSLLRTMDTVARYGGEEFIALLPQASASEAVRAAERVCTGIAQGSPGLPAYTVSIGIAVDTDGNTPIESLLAAADEALYAAKRGGRNQAVLGETTRKDGAPASIPTAQPEGIPQQTKTVRQ